VNVKFPEVLTAFDQDGDSRLRRSLNNRLCELLSSGTWINQPERIHAAETRASQEIPRASQHFSVGVAVPPQGSVLAPVFMLPSTGVVPKE